MGIHLGAVDISYWGADAIPAFGLQVGRDYPDNYEALREWFRWPDGFVCPKCHTPGRWRMGDGRFWCENYRRRVSVTMGTIFHRTRTPLTVWFATAWYVTCAKNGVSAKTLHRILGFGCYQTAWTMIHRFRTAMVRPGRDQLVGTVEVDAIYVGGVETGGHGRQTETKSIVVIAVELREPKGLGRARLRKVADLNRCQSRGIH